MKEEELNSYHIIRWRADGQGGWTDPELVDHAEGLPEAEAIYKEVLGEESRRPPEGYVRVEMVQVLRHRDYRPDKPG